MSDPTVLYEVADGVATITINRERQRNALDDATLFKLRDALEDAKRLEKKLGYSDKRKLDEYLNSIRELEKRIEAMDKSNVDLPPGYSVPAGKPRDFGAHVRIMGDMMALAFQTDSTRIASNGEGGR